VTVRRTRKWAFVAQDAQRFAKLGLSEREIAKRLGVAKSTITRAKKRGDLQVVVSNERPDDAVENPPARLQPAAWASSVREEYQLDSTDEALVTLAEAALSASRDMTATLREQLAAGARFAALVRQLALPGRKVAEAANAIPLAVNETPARKTNPPVRRRSTADPRKGLMAVK
jgi:IS30 family transposase